MTGPDDTVVEDRGPAEPPRRGGVKRALAIVLVVLLVFLVVCGAIAGIYVWRFSSDYKNLSISSVDISQLPNGVHIGSWRIFHLDVPATSSMNKLC